ncbi:hypothetical protein [Jiella marina]|uniref:hypothetical protein n=1 Tax=Jiella sp. LLJ827 TaxID=2917712 RepID=UPI0021006C70|nr:hypothetical protein [Jiella sp. LLJ827]MCQ0987345.1 hypothetical protein [Jiella sp. LLJ827]
MRQLVGLMRGTFAILALILVVSTARAEIPGLNELITGVLGDAALVETFSGRRFQGVYSDGSFWHESYDTGGALTYRDAAGQWAGDWSVRNARLCTFYRSDELVGGCFLVARRGKNCFDFYAASLAHEPMASGEDIRRGRNWTARGWTVDGEQTCPDDTLDLAFRTEWTIVVTGVSFTHR